MSEPVVIVRDEGSARIVTLNRADKRNAMNFEILAQLEEIMKEIVEKDSVRTVILNGAGPAFSAGIDFFALAGADMSGTGKFRALVQRLQNVTHLLARLEKPVIAVLHGYCIGMALEFALACDFRIAETGTRINIEEVRLGLIPDVGGSTRLVRTVGLPRAKELIMTGKTIDPETAEKWGLVNEVVPAGEGMAAAMRWHEELGKGAPLAVGVAKMVLDHAYELDMQSSMKFEAVAQSLLVRSKDFQEGVASRIEKRAPAWKGE